MFDIYYIGPNSKVKEEIPAAKMINSESEVTPRTKMYWVIDSDVEILDLEILKYRPPEYDQIFEHVWKINDNNYGGLKLKPTTKAEGIKQINHVVCTRKFEVLYQKTPQDYFKKNPQSKFVWCVDTLYDVEGFTFDWSPDMFEPNYIHNFHIQGQLEDRYPFEEGGINLYPVDWDTNDEIQVKFHGFLNKTSAHPYIFVDDPEDYTLRDHLPNEFVWLIDRRYEIDVNTLTWTPNQFERDYIHSFRLPYQLEEESWSFKHYEPNRHLGGIRLVPKDWRKATGGHEGGGVIIHKECPVRDVQYDVFFTNKKFTSDTFDYYAKRSLTEWFWVVDWDYEFNGKLTYVPAKHEQEYIHVFKWGLEQRYPPDIRNLWDNRVAGMYLVNKNFDFTKKKLHLNKCPIKYDIFYTEDMNNYLVPARKSTTDMFWLVDQEHFLDKLVYTPHRHDQQYLHIFKIPGQLLHKYPEDIINPADNRSGGVKLVPLDYENAQLKFNTENPTAQIATNTVYVDDINNFDFAPEGCAVWYIHSSYTLTSPLAWVPNDNELMNIHVFNIPEATTDDTYSKLEHNGGILYLPPTSNAERKTLARIVHKFSPIQTSAKFDIFSSVQQGMENSTTPWFWVIDSHVEVNSDFGFDYIPEEWDKKVHVWQKVNPISGKQYDYGGVSLVPLDLDTESRARPKYVRETACTQIEYPVYHIDPGANTVKQCEKFDTQTINSNYWVIDPHTELSPNFQFDYYPTQWDQNAVHVFQDQDGIHRNVRLYPKGTFAEGHTYTQDDIINNSFEDIKLMNNVASMRINWPVINLGEVTKDQFVDKLTEYNNMGYAYTWTVDDDVVPDSSIFAKGFTPTVDGVDKIHLWQRHLPDGETLHGYGGIRLWPTGRDYSTLTTSQLKLNRLKGLQYIREVASKYKPFDIVLITYKDEDAEQKYRSLKKKFKNVKWIDNVDGIFEAHKAAAEKVDTTMFWVVDGDATIEKDFTFNFVPDVYDFETTHVWKSRNPCTGDEYGYGGVKLLNTAQVRESTSWGLDFTTGLSSTFKVVDTVSCTTNFNNTALGAWRSAFREVAKLYLKSDADSKKRIENWLDPKNTHAIHIDYVIDGAKEGLKYAEQYHSKPLRMNRINNFEWLEQQYIVRSPNI